MKKGQVTLFVIVAIIVVSSLIVYFAAVKPRQELRKSNKPNFDRCVEKVINSNVNLLSKTAGMISPKFVYHYAGEKIPYLCYTNEYYKTCVVQTPFIKNVFERNLNKLSKKEVIDCYKNSLDELKKAGYKVSSQGVDANITIRDGAVHVLMKSESRVGSKIVRNVAVDVPSKIYKILIVATSILQYETSYGDVDTGALRNLYPDLSIRKLKRGDGTKIYFIEDPSSKTSLKFASRSVVFPPGY